MESSEDDLRAGNGIHLKQSDKAPTLQRPEAPPMTSVSIKLTSPHLTPLQTVKPAGFMGYLLHYSSDVCGFSMCRSSRCLSFSNSEQEAHLSCHAFSLFFK